MLLKSQDVHELIFAYSWWNDDWISWFELYFGRIDSLIYDDTVEIYLIRCNMYQFFIWKILEDGIIIMKIYCNFINTVTFLKHVDLFPRIHQKTVFCYTLNF